MQAADEQWVGEEWGLCSPPPSTMWELREQQSCGLGWEEKDGLCPLSKQQCSAP